MNEDGTLGEDKGNMSIDVAELNITDQKNKEESWSEGYSFSTSMGGNFDQAGKAGLAPGNGSTAVGANNSGSKTEGIAYGVLGKTKSLKVAGEDVADDSEVLAGVHRDISETSVVTKEETTGGLNVDMTVSNELFTGGQRQARDDNGDLAYDENGNAVMKDMNGFEILKNDIGLIDDMVYTKDDGLGGNLKGAAVNVGRVAGARARDAASVIKTTVTGKRDMTNAPGSNLASVYLEEHVERTDGTRTAMGAMLETIDDEVMGDFVDSPDIESMTEDEKIEYLNNKLEETPIRLIEGTELLLNPIKRSGKKAGTKAVKKSINKRLGEIVAEDMEDAVIYYAPTN